MNIFYVDSDPIKAAQALVNKHIVKMITEVAQLLSSAHHVLSTNTNNIEIYKLTHKNHPSSIWTRTSKQNYEWLYEHFIALLNEYTYRYGKIHKTSRLIEFLKNPPLNIPNIGFTKMPQAMPDEFKMDDSILAYRKYYIKGKQHLHKWKNRDKPLWVNMEIK